ncbi:hypothetical protein GCM10022267_74940 [Lentzea roselyniae]|uniref:RNA polymerase sigma-70 region 2 domain-containing protein n=1 Tax=Lentzea roselyniae TaxID=531940 RepID=A0ABP7C4H4_9PSEU
MEFTEYVARQRPALMRFATVLTCRTWLAEELVSDVLGRAFERWEQISGMDEPHAYVRRMVVNEYLSWRRRLTRTSPRAEVEPMVISDGADQRAERDAMIRRLAALPRKQRAAVVLRYYAGPGHEPGEAAASALSEQDHAATGRFGVLLQPAFGPFNEFAGAAHVETDLSACC